MMKKKGIRRDWTQCRTKFKHLKTTYKKHKITYHDQGQEGAKVQSFLGDRPQAEGLENSIDTSSDVNPSVSVSDNSEDGMLIRYG